MYLLRNNGLMLNNRLNAFDDTVSPNCTFCRIVDRDAAPRDGFLHFFFYCPVTLLLLVPVVKLYPAHFFFSLCLGPVPVETAAWTPNPAPVKNLSACYCSLFRI